MKKDRKFTKKLLSMVMCVALLISCLPAMVFAAEEGKTQLDISKGSITIGNGVVSGFAPDGNAVTTHNPEGYVITGTTSNNTITVTDAGSVDITLKNMQIRGVPAGKAGLDIYGVSTGSQVRLNLVGENIIQGHQDKSEQPGAVRMNAADSLTISGDGSLKVHGASNYYGGSPAIQGGSLTLNGGTVTLVGGNKILGSYGKTFAGGKLTVNGGVLNCHAGVLDSTTRGDVKATGIEIGTNGTLNVGAVTLVSGNTIDTSGVLNATATLPGTVNVTGGSVTVNASAGNAFENAPVLDSSAYWKVTANGNTVNFADVAAACTGNAQVTVEVCQDHTYGADDKCACGALSSLAGSDFTVVGTGTYNWDNGSKVLNITGGQVRVANKNKNSATSHRIYIRGTATVTLDNVNISTGNGAPIEIRDYNDTNVELILVGTNTLTSQASNRAAIHKTRGQQADSSAAATLTISGTGSLTAVGGNNAAGIGGGGYRGDTHNIIINSGTISAKGTASAAGIGSSNDGSTWNMVINGGKVTAIGDPGFGANTYNWQGVKEAFINGGMVTVNSHKGNTPTGGLVSTDGGRTYTVYGDYTLDQDLQIAANGKLFVNPGKTLTISQGKTLLNLGIIENYGAIVGNLVNQGIIYNGGTLPDGTAEVIYEQQVFVENGSGSGIYAKDMVVTLVADEPQSGDIFIGWTVQMGDIVLQDSKKATTTFTMPAGCVIVKANYGELVATVTDENGNQQQFSDIYAAEEAWRENCTLTLHKDLNRFHMRPRQNGTLDLNGHKVYVDMPFFHEPCTVKNGTITTDFHIDIGSDAVVTFENVTIENMEPDHRDVVIYNDGTIVDAGLTLIDVTISGGVVKKGLTQNNVTLSGIPAGGYTYDGTAHEPGVEHNAATLEKDVDYTVTFSHSDGSDSNVNAGTVTMTITGIGDYVGTVEKTYTINQVATAPETENTDKVDGITAENVKPENKADLEKAKADLEEILAESGDNYSDAAKQEIRDELKRIEEALKAIENVQTAEKAISDLPETVEPDDLETLAKVAAAKELYESLTDYEKSLIDEKTKEKLEKLLADAVAYDIIDGDGSAWTQNSDNTLVITVNGPVAKLVGVKVDGKDLAAKHYEVKAGSTIITLKASYLETLETGEHSITVLYTDGETSGTFIVKERTTVPETGDNSNAMLWTTVLLLCVAAMAVLLIHRKKFYV